MGQGSSSEPPPALTAEQLTSLVTSKFASKCFTPLELYSFKDNFRSFADATDGCLYWKEDTLIKFFGLPATCDIGSILFHACGNLGAFPFPGLAPAILDFEALVRVVTLMTGRDGKGLKKRPDRTRLLFRAFAVWDRLSAIKAEAAEENEQDDAAVTAKEVSVEEEDGYETDESEDLVLDELIGPRDHTEVAAKSSKEDIKSLNRAQIPIENLRKLVQFLLIIAPLEENQPIFQLADRFTPEALEDLQPVVDAVMAGFGEPAPGTNGIGYRAFKHAISTSMPYLLDPALPALFTHFLFSKNLDHSTLTPPPPPEPPQLNNSTILTSPILAQLSLFLPSNQLFSNLHPLYAGSEAGFSLGSLSTKVLKWNAPTILLITGQPISYPPSQQARTFLDSLPPATPTTHPAETYTFGVFLSSPWKQSHKFPFGDNSSILFQLSPKHEIYPASHSASEYAYFNKTDGIGFGAPVQDWKGSRRGSPYFNIGPVSLIVDPEGIEFAVFTHQGPGGSYRPAGDDQWQVRFTIEELEVWGCGGKDEAEEQRKAWAWEEREAKLRRELSLGKDIEADRALLEMAGLIGQNRSGGSI